MVYSCQLCCWSGVVLLQQCTKILRCSSISLHHINKHSIEDDIQLCSWSSVVLALADQTVPSWPDWPSSEQAFNSWRGGRRWRTTMICAWIEPILGKGKATLGGQQGLFALAQQNSRVRGDRRTLPAAQRVRERVLGQQILETKDIQQGWEGERGWILLSFLISGYFQSVP